MLTSVRGANKVSSSELFRAIHGVENRDDIRINVYHADELSVALKRHLWSLLCTGMRDMSTSSSFGWHPTQKKAEMFHHDARFLIASHVENHHPPDSPVSGFAIFRFDVEPNMEDEDEPVAYLYELHVSPQSEQKGIGSLLLRGVEAIGSHWGMKKVMLTVLTVNVNAIKFYARLDYTIDPTSWISSHSLVATAPGSDVPAEDDEQDSLGSEDRDIDYLILSKILPSSTNSP